MSSINFITQQISSFPVQLSHTLNTTHKRITAVAVLAMTCLAACYLLYHWCTCLQSKKVVQPPQPTAIASPPQSPVIASPPQPAAIASWDEVKKLLATEEPDAKGRIFVPGYGSVFKSVLEQLPKRNENQSTWNILKERVVICSNKEITLDGLTATFFFRGRESVKEKIDFSFFSSKELKKTIQELANYGGKTDTNFCFQMWKSIEDDPAKFKKFDKLWGDLFLRKLVQQAARWGRNWEISQYPSCHPNEKLPLKTPIKKEEILFLQGLLEGLCQGWPCSYKILDINRGGLTLREFFQGVVALLKQEQVDFYQMIKDQPKTIQAFIIYCGRDEEVFKRILESLENEDDHRLTFFENIIQYSQENRLSYGEVVRKFIYHLSDDQVENLTKLIIEQSPRSLELILKWISVLKPIKPHQNAHVDKIIAIATPHFSPQDILRMQNCQNMYLGDLHIEFPFFKKGSSIQE